MYYVPALLYEAFELYSEYIRLLYRIAFIASYRLLYMYNRG